MNDEAVSALRQLIDGELDAVIIEAGEYYVQFAQDGREALRVEAVGDANLAAPLTFDQRRGLAYLEFRSPAIGESAGNHYGSIAAVAEDAAELAFKVLTTVYSVQAEDIVVTTV